MTRAQQVRDWLLAHDHQRVDAWFAAHPPLDAEAHELFALNLIGAGRREQWAQARQHLQLAFEALPPRVSAGINLVQLLLESGQVAEALRVAERCAALAPGAHGAGPAALEKLFLALHANRSWERCHALLPPLHAQGHAPGRSALQALLDETRSGWWRSRRVGSTVLRLPQPGDAPALQALLADVAFRRRYHRDAEADAAGVARFIARAALPPLTSRRRDWVVCRDAAPAFGLVSLVDIDWPHRRAELMVGCRAQANPMAAAQATVTAMQFAFDALGLEKLSTSVYGDNPEAQANVRHLGFVPEGVLRAHLSEAGRRIDVHLSGLTRPDYQRLRGERGFHARWGEAHRVIEP